MPIKPRKKKNIVLGAILGLIIGVGLVFFLEYLDNTIKSPEDVEGYLGIPLLGVLEKTIAKAKVSDGSVTPDLIAHDSPLSNFSEAIRRVRTGITFSVSNNKKLIMVTSSVMGEGKTFAASNLATVFAQTGKNVLLVDADLRKPRISAVFRVNRNPGLSNYLAGENDLESVIKSTTVPNLSVVPCGTIPPNPSEVLESSGMKEFCNTVRERFDLVIFDSPPTMVVTDPVVLSKNMDGVVIIIKSGEAVKNKIKRAISQITRGQSKILGAIINYVDITKGTDYYYGGYSYYQYGHSSEEEMRETEKV